jgi:hypothetical protein
MQSLLFGLIKKCRLVLYKALTIVNAAGPPCPIGICRDGACDTDAGAALPKKTKAAHAVENRANGNT